MAEGPAVVVLGGTGAVGGHAVRTLAGLPAVRSLLLLGRRPVEGLDDPRIRQRTVDVHDPSTYRDHLAGHDSALCTLGVGEPSKVSRPEFVRVDHDAVLGFAAACRDAGVRHFQLLGSVGADPRSRVFYLRTKGELEAGLVRLRFERLSLFRPSMILTPTNRYGATQAVALAVWPWLRPLLLGPLRKYRGIRVEQLGRAMALNAVGPGSGVEILHWDAIDALARLS